MKTNHATQPPSHLLLLATGLATLLTLSACSDSKRSEVVDQADKAVAE